MKTQHTSYSQFADKEIHETCFRIDFDFFFWNSVKWGGKSEISLSLIEEWLWERHSYLLEVHEIDGTFVCDVSHEDETTPCGFTHSPISTKIEGIRVAVKAIEKQKNEGK